ncbi:unnamed protein product [Calypogeia fissa]
MSHEKCSLLIFIWLLWWTLNTYPSRIMLQARERTSAAVNSGDFNFYCTVSTVLSDPKSPGEQTMAYES